MRIVIGGSSSTGSSLLNQCLGRHEDVVISSETSIFARPQLIKNWKGQRARLFQNNKLRPLRSYGWHRENGVQWPLGEWGLTMAEIKSHSSLSTEYQEFIDRLDHSICSQNNQKLWVEKTPANAISFPLLNEILSDTMLILTIRHPLEAISSMIYRGFDPLYACCVYLLSSSFGLSFDRNSRVIIKYEELLTNYEQLTSEILSRAGLSEGYVDWSNRATHTKIDSWRYAEDDLPAPAEHDRFASLSVENRNYVLSIVDSLRINESFHIFQQFPEYKSIREIATELDYELPDSQSNNRFRLNLKRKYFLNSLSRTLHLDPLNLFNSPFITSII